MTEEVSRYAEITAKLPVVFIFQQERSDVIGSIQSRKNKGLHGYG